ncbi:MAG: tol-pal system-associated acyl-CoA thioesterase [Marinosulfonomonas sp.]
MDDETENSAHHRFPVRVYYEDTDLAGIVYYANYLKFIERARTEFVRGLGIDQTELKDQLGLVFAVRRVEADYLRPGKFDDVLTVATTVAEVTGARIVLRQDVLREDALLFSAVVTLVAIGMDGGAKRLPADIRRIFQNWR